MSKTLNILLVQAELVSSRPDENRQRLEDMSAPSASAADLVVFPETFSTAFLGDQDAPPETMQGETVAWMTNRARDWNAAVCGSIAIEAGGKRWNRFVFVAPDGRRHEYDKRHLFGMGGEDRRYAGGTQRVVFEWRGWRICPQICYDLRFPVWCRNQDDYDVLIVVANWPAPRIDAWTALLRARAIENQAYVVGVNRVGSDHRGNRYVGHSGVYGPGGAVCAEFGDRATARVVALSRETLKKIRKELPFHKDRDLFSIET